MKVQKKTCISNAETIFQFDVKASEFLVKNFTTGFIYVCLGSIFNIDEAITIAPSTGELIEDCFDDTYVTLTTKKYDSVIVKAENEGGVEVRCTEN